MIFQIPKTLKKKLAFISDIEFSSFDKIDGLTEVLLLPVELLRRIWAVERKIGNCIGSIKNMTKTNTQFDSGLINQDMPRTMQSVRLYQRQLACYFIQEASRRGYNEMANIMAKVREFKPDNYLQRINDYLPEHSMPPEPEDYCLCKIENLVEQAKQEADSINILHNLVRDTE